LQDGSLIGAPIIGGDINLPMGIAVDSMGNVWIANSGAVRVPCAAELDSNRLSPEGAGAELPPAGASVTLRRPDGKLRTFKGEVFSYPGGSLWTAMTIFEWPISPVRSPAWSVWPSFAERNLGTVRRDIRPAISHAEDTRSNPVGTTKKIIQEPVWQDRLPFVRRCESISIGPQPESVRMYCNGFL